MKKQDQKNQKGNNLAQEEKKKSQEKPSQNKKKPPLYNYSYYFGIGFRLVAMVLIGFGIGYWLDSRMNNETPYFTLIFSLLAVVISLYHIVKEFL